MTLAQVQRAISQLKREVQELKEDRLQKVERQLSRLNDQLTQQRSIDAIREGLRSADRAEGEPATKVLSRLRKRHKVKPSR